MFKIRPLKLVALRLEPHCPKPKYNLSHFKIKKNGPAFRNRTEDQNHIDLSLMEPTK